MSTAPNSRPGPPRPRPRPRRLPETPQQLGDAVRLALEPKTVHHIARRHDHLVVMLEGYEVDPEIAREQVAATRGVGRVERVGDAAILRVWPVNAW